MFFIVKLFLINLVDLILITNVVNYGPIHKKITVFYFYFFGFSFGTSIWVKKKKKEGSGRVFDQDSCNF